MSSEMPREYRVVAVHVVPDRGPLLTIEGEDAPAMGDALKDGADEWIVAAVLLPASEAPRTWVTLCRSSASPPREGTTLSHGALIDATDSAIAARAAAFDVDPTRLLASVQEARRAAPTGAAPSPRTADDRAAPV